MRRRAAPHLGLRGRVVLSFALSGGLISLIFAIAVFILSSGYMRDQRERSAERQAVAHAELVRGALHQSDAAVAASLAALETPVDTHLLLRRDSRWFSSEPTLTSEAIPTKLVDSVSADDVNARTTVHTTVRGKPYLATGVRLDAEGAALFELAPTVELQATLRVLRLVVAGCAIAATAGGALLGWQASRRVLTPLHHLADTTAQIAGGDLDRRLQQTEDRELRIIVDSFNTMVDSLQQRIERERRFFGDVSHELRTPLTTLLTSVSVLGRHADELPDRSQRAVALITAELDHLRRLLDDLLALARMDAGLHQDDLEPCSLVDVVRQALATSGHSADLMTVEQDSPINGRRKSLERAFGNLIRNADRHGLGLRAVRVARDGDRALVTFDDDGPGVPPQDRARIFERFATGHTVRKTTMGTGTGIGLALVAETVGAHGGSVTCVASPSGGARFEVRMPVEIVTRL